MEASDHEEAQRVGERLMRIGHSSGYEVVARAHLAEGRRADALRVLREGTEAAPAASPLWTALAVLLSDEGAYEESLRALDRALACPGVDVAQVTLDRAVVRLRQRRYEDCLQTLAVLDPADDIVALKVDSMRLACWVALDRIEEAVELARERSLPEPRNDRERGVVAGYHVAAARTFHDGDPERARRHLRLALEHDRSDRDALDFLRVMQGETSDRARRYRLVVKGRWPRPLEGSASREPPGFLSTLWVVADSPAAALELARPFEPPEAREGLEIESADDEGPARGELTGVVAVHRGRIFFAAVPGARGTTIRALPKDDAR